MGAGSRQRHTAMLPPQQFHCLLDELPLHLIPRRNFNRKRCRQDLSQALFLNPQCPVLPAGELPPELEAARDLLKDSTCRERWLGCAIRPLAHGSILAGSPAGSGGCESSDRRTGAASVPEAQRLLLAAAGILTPADRAQRRLAEWSEIVNTRSQTFREKNYVPLGRLDSPVQSCGFTPLLPLCNPARGD